MNKKPLVKICGIKDVATAIATSRAGADYIGLVFHDKSTRNIEIESAKKIVESLSEMQTITVGVFVDQKAEEIINICKYAGIKLVQLHGANAQDSISYLSKEIRKILVITVEDDGDIKNKSLDKLSFLNKEQDFILFDGKNPGSGKSFDLGIQEIKNYNEFNFFLAGGLNSKNVKGYVEKFNPFAVDVSSSVEKEKGIKDIELIRSFIREVKYGE